MRLNKIVVALAAATVIASGLMAQPGGGTGNSNFYTGISLTGDISSVTWGDANFSTNEIILAPGTTFYLWFRADWVPGYGGSTRWGIINYFFDLTRQSQASGAEDLKNFFDIVEGSEATQSLGSGYTWQAAYATNGGGIYANSVAPDDSGFPFVTSHGAAFKLLTTRTSPVTSAWAQIQLQLKSDAPFRRYELSLNPIAGKNSYDSHTFGNPGFIGSEGTTVRTNFGTNGNPNSDYGNRFGITILVPEPASMIALGTGLAGLLALRRRRK